MSFPENIAADSIADESQLDALLTTPSDALIEAWRPFHGTVVILGIGGKMGGTLGVRLMRAIRAAGTRARVVGVSRFSDAAARASLEDAGITTVAADILDLDRVRELPDADRIVFMAGRKFGTTGAEHQTWAMNAVPPAYICHRYAGVPMVVYSTGSVYPPVPVVSGGARETHPLEPVGEYANSAVARERVFAWAAERYQTPTCFIRLFYANDLRYGVIRDVADRVAAGEPVDLSVGAVNVIWQGDAVDQSLRAFECATVPPSALNVTGPETLSVRYLAERLGELLGTSPTFVNEEAPVALLGNAAEAFGRFGYPEVPVERMIRWTAAWVNAGGRGLGKPTHYEVRDGRY
jgi:nucleoside-diphosphate-sugar epimerase